jgi:hypothetical protein
MTHSDPCISCTCGHADTIDAWTSTPINGELPRGVYQCPKCSKAFKRQGVTDRWGTHRIELQPVEARL